MTRQVVEDITFRVGATEIATETLCAGIAGDIVVMSTAAPTLGATIHSTYHGHEGLDTVVVRLALLLGDSGQVVETRPRNHLPVNHARQRCLLDHLAYVREVLADAAEDLVTVDVLDAAAGAIL